MEPGRVCQRDRVRRTESKELEANQQHLGQRHQTHLRDRGLAPGLTREEFATAYESFAALVHGPPPSDDLEREFDELPLLGDAVAFAGIGRIPLRAGCASLAWRALEQVLAAE